MISSKQIFLFSLCLFGILFLTMPRAFCAQAPVKPEDNFALFITGLSGSNQFKIHMNGAAKSLREVLRANGYGTQQMVRFSDKAESGDLWGKSEIVTKEKLEEFLKDTPKRLNPYDRAFIFICGHANGRDEEAMFHLPGPDIAYQNLIEGIDGIPAREMIIVVIASQGHTWIRKLGRPGRVIIAGNGLRQFDFIPMLFLRYFARNLRNGVFDPSQENGSPLKASLRDVFIQTQKEVQDWYRRTNLHPTEVALIDADGDGKGQTLIMKGAEFDSWAEGERKAHEVLEPFTTQASSGEKRSATVQEEKKKEGALPPEVDPESQDPLPEAGIDLPMDPDLPDGKAAQTFIFTIPGGKSHGR